jgi:hypothetical protein
MVVLSDLAVARIRLKLINSGLIPGADFAPSYEDMPEWQQQLWHQIALTHQARFYR